MIARDRDSLEEKKAVDTTTAFKSKLLNLNWFNLFLADPELRSLSDWLLSGTQYRGTQAGAL